MSSNAVPPAPDGRTRSPALSWSNILGLGALALLWPLLELTGIAGALGDPVTTVLLLVVVGGVWVGTVGLGGEPRPVATLTLAGTVYGTLVVLLAAALGIGRELHGAATFYALVPLGLCTALGTVAGLLASTVQRISGRRS
jgi:hypothetical protein